MSDFQRGNALIRHFFYIKNPEKLAVRRWSQLVREAFWLMNEQQRLVWGRPPEK